VKIESHFQELRIANVRIEEDLPDEPFDADGEGKKVDQRMFRIGPDVIEPVRIVDDRVVLDQEVVVPEITPV
jgi:hypothetical protein